jgi:hypothetical protein
VRRTREARLGLTFCAGALLGLIGCSTSHPSSATSSLGATSTQGTGAGTTGSATGAAATNGSAGSTASSTTGFFGTATSSGGGTSGSCLPDSGLGGPCLTTADCGNGSGLICSSDHGGGACVVPEFPPLVACASAGTGCGPSADAGCCGLCIDGGCDDLAHWPCQDYPGAPCGEVACCQLLSCVNGACQPSCGQETAPCDPDAGNGDCCIALGFTCQASSDGRTVYACNNIFSVPPGGGCVSACIQGRTECELGAPCDPFQFPDNCAPAGLACDPNLDVCTRPYETDACIQGGPPCAPNSYLLNSLATEVCAVVPSAFAKPVCAQLCQSTGDCVDPSTYCCTTCSPPVCIPSYFSPESCQPFGVCNSEGTHDGLCVPFTVPLQLTFGWCLQVIVDGGGPGSSCNTYASRENPAFCDTSDWCIVGMCAPICNAGTHGGMDSHPPGPFCPDSNRQKCISAFGQLADSSDFGFCLTSCALFPDAGEPRCLPSDGGAPQGCVPLYVFGLNDDVIGGCAGMSTSAAAIGQPCTQPLGGPSACSEGSLCYHEPTGGTYCDRVCLLGTACSDGSKCQPYALAPGLSSSKTGICFTSVGGTDGG